MKQWTREQYSEYLKVKGFGITEHIEAMLFLDRVKERGDVVVVYENSDLGHPEIGFPKIVSYGSDSSYLTRDQFPIPPTTFPDTSTDINWRYCLQASVTG